MTVSDAIPGDAATFDYIVCGGGTAGSVVAARLAEDPTVSVLVIEAGQDNELLENTKMAGGWGQLLDTENDWNIETEPNVGANGRRVKVSRGKFLGGCSGVNGTLCVRGTKQDYDDWGLDGWSGEEVWENMDKAETFHPKPWFDHDQKNHGKTGPLHTEPHDLAPISKLILESFRSKGLDLQDDMFTTGDNAHGCGNTVRTVHNGLRSTGADFLLNAGPNLFILTKTTVDRVLLEKFESEIRAAAVRVIAEDGITSFLKARREIIVSGGAYCTPAILWRSGIGPKEELQDLGIKCQIDLPGVGKNLMDHLIVFMFYETEKSGVTNDYLLYHGNALAETYRLWKEEKKGALSTFPFGAFAFARLDERLKGDPLWDNAECQPRRDPMGLTPSQPSVEFFTTECYGGPKQYDHFPTEDKHAFSMIAELFAPKSRGSVCIKSVNPSEKPIVDHNYLDDPLDLLVLSEACRFGNEIIMEGAGTKDIVKGSWPPELKHHTYTSRKDWKSFVKENATTCYHAAGTCKMGQSDDAMAVLDAKLRVRNVQGLRVADTSVMPTLNQGHTQLPAYAIGEKCASMIKASWSKFTTNGRV